MARAVQPQGLMQQNKRALIHFAKMIGTVTGYLQRSRRGDMFNDAVRLVTRSPDRAMMAAAAVGLVLGTVLRKR